MTVQVKILAVSAVVAVLGMGVTANLLNDPGFEGEGAAGWTLNVNPAFSADLDSTIEAQAGLESFRVSWSGISGWLLAEVYQDVTVPGDWTYEASVYAKITTELDNPCFAYLETIFYDDSWNEVGSHLQSPKLYQVTDWTLLENSGTTPADAETARIRLVTFNEGGDSSQGTVYWDSANAVIPEPLTLSLLMSGLGGLFLLRRKGTAK